MDEAAAAEGGGDDVERLAVRITCKDAEGEEMGGGRGLDEVKEEEEDETATAGGWFRLLAPPRLLLLLV